jgi:hypothetical protein
MRGGTSMPGKAVISLTTGLQGTVPLWEWIGDETVTTFSY